jgi:hypothetical protein
MSDQPQQPEESARPAQSEEAARPASDGGARSAEGDRSTGASTSAEDPTSTSPTASGQQSASSAEGGASEDAAAAEPGASGPGGQRSPGRDNGQAPLFAPQEGDRLRGEWESVQAAFVDDPRAAVQRANALVSEVVHDLTESFTTAQSRLEQQWSQGEDVSTEDLRQALHRYRSFFDRLLSL